MIVASFDVGAKNLAWCVVNSESGAILHWTVASICGDRCDQVCLRHGCGARAKWTNGTEVYCGRHRIDRENPNWRRIPDPPKKQQNIHQMCRGVIRVLDRYEIFNQCHKVLIEQQPSKNARMNKLSYMIYTYFLMKYNIDSQFISPKHKLRVNYDGPPLRCHLKTRYARNKWYAVKYCEYFITNEQDDPQWLELFQNTKKKDDLADSYLQCRYWLARKFTQAIRRSKVRASS